MTSTLTVVTAAADTALVAVEDAMTYLGSPSGLSEELLDTYIQQSSAAIARYCRRVFAAETVAETFRLKRCRTELVLARYPVNTIASVVQGETTLDVSQYEVDAGILYPLCGSNRSEWGASAIVVTYTAGYELPDHCPADLQQACLSLVKNQVLSRTRDPLAKRVEIPDVRTVDYWVGGVGANGALPPDVISLIEPFRARLR